MKKLILLSILLMSACGGGSGQGPDVVYITDIGESDESSPSVVTIKPTDITVPAPNAALPTKSTRFDEHGNIQGIYGVPYVPKKQVTP